MSEEGDYILIPCHKLLKTLAFHLESPPPRYLVKDAALNKMAVIVHPTTAVKPQKFIGQARKHRASSAQDAARIAIKTQSAQHFIGVEDITLLTQELFDRVSGLYELKRLEMLRAEAQQEPAHMEDNSFKARAIYSATISIDFKIVLGLILEKYKVKTSSPFDCIERTPSEWVAWGELTCPTIPMRIQPFISDRCIDEEGAWQSVGKKYISYLIGVYNFQVIDINFDYMKGTLLRAFSKQHLKLYEEVKCRTGGVLEIPNPWGEGPSQSIICPPSVQCPSVTTACQPMPPLSIGKQPASLDARTSGLQDISGASSQSPYGCPTMGSSVAHILVGNQTAWSGMSKPDMDATALAFNKKQGKRKVVTLEPLCSKKKYMQLGNGKEKVCSEGQVNTELCLPPPNYSSAITEPILPPI